MRDVVYTELYSVIDNECSVAHNYGSLVEI